MKNIKFRAWDEKLKRFHYWDSESQPHDNIFWSMAKAENMPISQFTGLTDKNGKEIYDGDIVKLHYGSTYSVEYIQRLALYSICRPVGNVASYPFIDFDRCEVIGNIHDNPELL